MPQQSAASEAREKMIERMQTAHLPKVKQDKADNAPGRPAAKASGPKPDAVPRSSKEAREAYLCRLRGQTYVRKDAKSYREDSADPVAWYRDLLRDKDFSEAAINRMVE
jgi:hypothetical protein